MQQFLVPRAVKLCQDRQINFGILSRKTPILIGVYQTYDAMRGVIPERHGGWLMVDGLWPNDSRS